MDEITSTTVMGGRTAEIGSRVKHFGQRWTGCATATVVGFEDVGSDSSSHDGDTRLSSWIKVLVELDLGVHKGLYGIRWDWDRTELAPDV